MTSVLRRNKLALAMATALGGAGLLAAPAQAVNLADDGIGDVLIYQYYTNKLVENPQSAGDRWQTLFHVVNTSDDTVAVKVNFREARNSRDVLDFVLVLSPWDVWTGFVTDDDAGNPILRTNDESCTSPAAITSPTANNPQSKILRFRNTGYTGSRLDGGPTDLARAREGYVEMLNMGQAISGSAIDNAAQSKNCALIGSAFLPNNLGATAAQFTPPDNALKGNGYMINFARGQGGGFDPVVLANFSETRLVEQTSSFLGLPDLDAANPPISVVRDDTPGVAPRTIMDQWTDGADAVSAVLTRNEVHQEWASRIDNTTGLNNSTELVFTFPTKRFYVDSEIDRVPEPPPEDIALAPFTNLFQPNGQSCHNADAWIFDREENGPDGQSPPLFPIELQLCNEVNVLTFRADEAGTQLNSDVPVRTLIDGVDTGANTIREADLPVTIVDAAGDDPRYFGYLKVMFDSSTPRFFDTTQANANAGLGSDDRADQAYNDTPTTITFNNALAGATPTHPYTGAAFANWAQWCAGYQIVDPNTGIPGYDFNGDGFVDSQGENPPIFDVTGTQSPVLSGLVPFPSTLTLQGYEARPLLSGLTGAVTGPNNVEDARCDNPVTVANEAVQPLYTVNVVDGWATYAGYPTVGWMMSFRSVAGDQTGNYSTILQHGYSRNIDVGDDLLSARYQHVLDEVLGLPAAWTLAPPDGTGF